MDELEKRSEESHKAERGEIMGHPSGSKPRPRRWLVASAAVAATLAVIVLYSSSTGVAQAPEIDALDPPHANPDVITSGAVTFVTFTAMLPDLNLNVPVLQFYDSHKARWRRIERLRDDGQFEDDVSDDGIFTSRLRFSESAGITHIAIERPLFAALVALLERLCSRLSHRDCPALDDLREKQFPVVGQTLSPVELRVAAREKGRLGLAVSAPLPLAVDTSSTVIIDVPDVGSPASLDVPPSFVVSTSTDRGDVVLEKFGVEGYRIELDVRSNPSGLSLEEWIFLEALEFTKPGAPPGAPSNFDEYGQAEVTPIEVAGLPGLLVTETGLQTSIEIFLDDSQEQRVFWFGIFGSNPIQDLNLYTNVEEALTIVRSLEL